MQFRESLGMRANKNRKNNKPAGLAFMEAENVILREEIEALKKEKILERENLLKDIARRLVAKNMAFPIIKEIVDLPDYELNGIFYGSQSQ